MAVIIVTGTPGAGKSTIARLIASYFHFTYIDVLALIKKNKLYDSYDRLLKSYVVDVEKLNRFLISLIKKEKNIVLDSHLAHYLDRKYVDLCIVVTCNPAVLRKRFEKRRYSREKIQENIDAELFGVCLYEAQEKGHHVFEVDTTQRLNKGLFFRKLDRLL